LSIDHLSGEHLRTYMSATLPPSQVKSQQNFFSLKTKNSYQNLPKPQEEAKKLMIGHKQRDFGQYSPIKNSSNNIINT
jgi:hypothetical protein